MVSTSQVTFALTECRASKVIRAPSRSRGSSRGRKCAVSFVFAPTSVWARVRAWWWVTAESRCLRPADRRADPLSDLPSTAITCRCPGAAVLVFRLVR